MRSFSYSFQLRFGFPELGAATALPAEPGGPIHPGPVLASSYLAELFHLRIWDQELHAGFHLKLIHPQQGAMCGGLRSPRFRDRRRARRIDFKGHARWSSPVAISMANWSNTTIPLASGFRSILNTDCARRRSRGARSLKKRTAFFSVVRGLERGLTALPLCGFAARSS